MSLAALLKQIDIFFDLTPAQLALIAGQCAERRCAAGEVIFAENTAGQELYIIAQGEVEIQIDPSTIRRAGPAAQTQVTIARLQRGQSFGEIALVDQGLRTATAIAAADTTLLVLTRQQLLALCEAQPALGYSLMRNLAADLALKMRAKDLQIREHLLEAAEARPG